MKQDSTIKIAIVDDHDMIHNGIKLLLRNDERYAIIHEAYNGKECLEQLQKLPVDLVLTDISMPEMNGIELTEQVRSAYEETKVLLLTMHDEDEFVQQALEVDADGYVLKNTTSNELKQAIEKVIAGGFHYSQTILDKIMLGLHHTEPQEEVTLSERELEIVQLICDELTTKEIAEKLFLSPNTIETHRKNILRKTGVKSTVGLVKFAILHQLVDVT